PIAGAAARAPCLAVDDAVARPEAAHGRVRDRGRRRRVPVPPRVSALRSRVDRLVRSRAAPAGRLPAAKWQGVPLGCRLGGGVLLRSGRELGSAGACPLLPDSIRRRRAGSPRLQRALLGDGLRHLRSGCGSIAGLPPSDSRGSRDGGDVGGDRAASWTHLPAAMGAAWLLAARAPGAQPGLAAY